MSERFVEVKMPGCTAFLYPSEIQELLKNDINLYKKGLKRGKYIQRSRTQKQREQAKQ